MISYEFIQIFFFSGGGKLFIYIDLLSTNKFVFSEHVVAQKISHYQPIEVLNIVSLEFF